MAESTHPEALLRSENDLPFVPLEPGITFQLLKVNLEESMWVVRMRFSPGAAMPRHRHTGKVLAFTLKGSWRYREYGALYEAGSFVYEPAGSIHTLEIPSRNKGETEILFVNFGANVNYDERGEEDYVLDAKAMLEKYRAACREADYPEPGVIQVKN